MRGKEKVRNVLIICAVLFFIILASQNSLAINQTTLNAASRGNAVNILNVNSISGTYVDTATNNNVFWSAGSSAVAGTKIVAGALNFTYNISNLGLKNVSNIQQLRFNVSYCHSSSPTSCVGLVSTTYNPSNMWIYNYQTSAYVNLGSIIFREGAEGMSQYNVTSGFSNYVKNNLINVRYRFNFTAGNNKAAYLAVDYAPLTIRYDKTPPRITYQNPTETSGTFVKRNFVRVNVTSVDANLKNITIRLYNSSKALKNTQLNTTSPFFYNFTSLTDGLYYFNVTSFDNYGNFNKTATRNVTVDTVLPKVIYQSPTETSGTFVSRNFVRVNASVVDVNFRNLTVRLYNSSKVLVSSKFNTSNPFFYNFTGLNDGLYFFNVSSFDKAGNFNKTLTRNVSVDTKFPSISYQNPTETSGTFVNRNFVRINVSASDANLKNITIRVYNSSYMLIRNQSQTTSPFFYNVTGLADGLYYFNSTAYDKAGKSNSTLTRNITVDTKAPGIINRINHSLTNQSVIISWDTTEPANASVRYGITKSFGSVKSNLTFALNHDISLTNLLNYTLYYYNVTSCDAHRNCNTTGPFNFTTLQNIEQVKPGILQNFPNNTSIDGDGNVTFNCSATDNSALSNISLYLNGILNQTVNVGGSSNSTKFTIINLADGQYNWSCNAYDAAGNYNSTANRSLIVSSTSVPTYDNFYFAGSTTDWSAVPDLRNVCNGTAILDNPGNDTIQWHGCVNAVNADFDGNVFLNFNNVTVFSENLNETFNSSAQIIMRGLFYADIPYILRDGVRCNESNGCTDIVYDNDTGVLIFNVSHFTSYWTESSTTLGIWDETDTGVLFGNQIKYPYQQVLFVANYTKSGIALSGGSCVINFTDFNDVMSYNSTYSVFLYNRSFSNNGTLNWNVTCSESGAKTITLNDTVNITGDNVPPSIILNDPTNGFLTGVNVINFNWTAFDDVYSALVCNLSIDDVVNVSNVASANGSAVNYSISSISEGLHFWNVSCWDMLNNINVSETRNFTIDTVEPSVVLNEPISGFLTNVNDINFNWTAINGADTNLTCNLTIDNLVNVTDIASLNNTPTNYSIFDISDGLHFWNVTCWDDAANSNTSETRNFSIDSVAPDFINVYPLADSQINQSDVVMLKVNLSENAAVFANVSWASTSQLVNLIYNGTDWWFNNTFNLTYWVGSYDVMFNATDSFGNSKLNHTNFTVVDVTVPAVYDLKPVSGIIYLNGTVVNVSVNVTDPYWPNVDTVLVNVTWDLGSELLVMNNVVGDLWNATFNSTLDAGRYNVTIIANDTSGNLNDSAKTWFNISLSYINKPPKIILDYPQNDTQINNTNSLTVNFTAIDDLNSTLNCSLYVNAVLNQTNASVQNDTLTEFALNVNFGTYYWYINCSDWNISNFSEVRTFSVNDTLVPFLSVESPVNDSWYLIDNIDLNYTVNDAYLDRCWYVNVTGQTVDLGAGCSNITFSAIEGYQNISVFVNDTSNNVNSSQVFFYVDTLFPSLTVESPVNNSLYNSALIDLNYTVSEANLDKCWYINVTGQFVDLPGCGNVTFNALQGNNNITVFINDSINHVNYSQLFFYVDSIAPIVVLNDPSSGVLFGVNVVNFNWTVFDNLDTVLSCNLTLDGTVNVSGISVVNGTPENYSLSGIGEGLHWWNVSCWDMLNNVNVSETRNFTVDTVEPSVVLNDPVPGFLTNVDYINFNWTASNGVDPVLDCNLTVNDVVNLTNIASPSGSPVNYTVGGFADGYYVWNVSCWDDALKVNTSETRNFTIDTVYPSLSVENPVNNTNYSNVIIDLNFSVFDVNLDSCWFVNVTGQFVSLPGCGNLSFNALQGNNNITVYVNDTVNNVNSSQIFFFVDSVVPVISNVANVSITNQSAEILWDVDEPANGTLEYGLSSALGSFVYNSSYILSHNVSLTNLLNDTLYYYNITSCDVLGNCNTVGTYNFTTLPNAYVNKEPKIILSYPLNDSQINNINIVVINFTVIDDLNLSLSCDLFVDGVLNQSNGSVQNDTLTSFILPVSLGSYDWFVNCSDGVLSNVSQTWSFSINDTLAPIVKDLTPTAGASHYNGTIVVITANVTDNYMIDSVVANITWSTGSQLLAMSNTGDIWNASFSNTQDIGRYNVTIFANDTSGNLNGSETTWFNITNVPDTTAPKFNETSTQPQPDSSYNQSNIVPLSVCLDENVTVFANVSWDSTSQVISLNYNGTQWCYNSSFSNTVLLGLYNITFNATDNSGNSNVTFSNFTINDVSAPSVTEIIPIAGTNFLQNSTIQISVNVTDPYYNNMGSVIANITWDSTFNETTLSFNSSTGLWEGSFADTSTFGKYNLSIIATDNAANVNNTETSWFNITAAPDTVPPVISNVNSINITNQSAKITWDTDENSNATVRYGVSLSLGSTSVNATFALSHSVLLTNLISNKTYFYNVTSCDVLNNCNSSGIYNFTTLENIIPDLTLPVIVSYEITPRDPAMDNSTFINASATDNVNVSAIFANITRPDGSVVTVNLGVNYVPTMPGRHNVTIFANDTDGNIAQVTDYFIAGVNTLKVQVNVVNNLFSGINANLSVLFGETGYKLGETLFLGQDLQIRTNILYNLLFNLYSGDILVRLNGINFSNDLNKTLGVDKTQVSGYLVTYGLFSNYSFSNAVLVIDYSSIGYNNENLLEVYRCTNWNFASRQCNSPWVKISAVQNKIANTFTITTTGFSAYSIKQGVAPSTPSESGGGTGGGTSVNTPPYISKEEKKGEEPVKEIVNATVVEPEETIPPVKEKPGLAIARGELVEELISSSIVLLVALILAFLAIFFWMYRKKAKNILALIIKRKKSRRKIVPAVAEIKPIPVKIVEPVHFKPRPHKNFILKAIKNLFSKLIFGLSAVFKNIKKKEKRFASSLTKEEKAIAASLAAQQAKLRAYSDDVLAQKNVMASHLFNEFEKVKAAERRTKGRFMRFLSNIWFRIAGLFGVITKEEKKLISAIANDNKRLASKLLAEKSMLSRFIKNLGLHEKQLSSEFQVLVKNIKYEESSLLDSLSDLSSKIRSEQVLLDSKLLDSLSYTKGIGAFFAKLWFRFTTLFRHKRSKKKIEAKAQVEDKKTAGQMRIVHRERFLDRKDHLKKLAYEIKLQEKAIAAKIASLIISVRKEERSLISSIRSLYYSAKKNERKLAKRIKAEEKIIVARLKATAAKIRKGEHNLAKSAKIEEKLIASKLAELSGAIKYEYRSLASRLENISRVINIKKRTLPSRLKEVSGFIRAEHEALYSRLKELVSKIRDEEKLVAQTFIEKFESIKEDESATVSRLMKSSIKYEKKYAKVIAKDYRKVKAGTTRLYHNIIKSIFVVLAFALFVLLLKNPVYVSGAVSFMNMDHAGSAIVKILVVILVSVALFHCMKFLFRNGKQGNEKHNHDGSRKVDVDRLISERKGRRSTKQIIRKLKEVYR